MTRRPASWAALVVASSAAQPGAPSRSKQASCGLTATHDGPAASIASRQWRSTAAPVRAATSSGGASRAGSAPTASGQRADGSGSRPSTIWLRRSSTSAASRSAKPSLGRSPTAYARGSCCCSALGAALDGVLEGRTGAEPRHAAGGDLDPLARLRVHALTRASIGDRELAEPGEVDVSPTAQCLLDHSEDGVDGVARLLLCKT